MPRQTIDQTNFSLPGQTDFYRGKVRDVYYLEDRVCIVATDRISSFDHILPRSIPFKGQVLNQLAGYFLNATKEIVPNWLIAQPDPNVTLGKRCAPFKVEMVIRGLLTGHAWRKYRSGKRSLCGVQLPEGMKEFEAFPEPIITPSTKADEGHDEDISKEEIIRQGIVDEKSYEKLETYTRLLFDRGREMAKERGLILADTKYEFGHIEGEIFLMDEIHTPDSSRYFYLNNFEELIESGEAPRQLSKEFVRKWLIQNHFQGKEGHQMPEIPDSFVDEISARYIDLFEILTGENFEAAKSIDPVKRIEQNLLSALA